MHDRGTSPDFSPVVWKNLGSSLVRNSGLAARRGEKVRIAGLVAAARRLVTRGDRIMQFVTLEDEHGLVETVLFPDVYASLQDPVTTPGPFIVGGRVEDDNGEVQLRVSEVLPFYLRPAR